MNDNLPDNAPSQDLRHDEVQDYLDILLRQATERPEAQPDQITEHKEQAESTRVLQQPVGKSAALLTMIGGTSVAPVRPAIVNGFPPTKVSLPPSILPSSARPFAEPSKPLAFKVRIPKAPDSDEAPAVPPVEKQPEPANQLLLSPVPEQAHEPEVVSSPAAESVTEVKTSPLLASQYQWLENGRPSWAQQSFECLLFSVGGLTLAVPLVELGSIYPITDGLTPLFGQADWFMGLMPVKETNIRTVDTAKLVMPERYSDQMQEQFAYVISINGFDWGLAVDTVFNSIKLHPDDVRWRGERSKRPWLAGTVVEHMCALLDVSQLAMMLIGESAE